MSYTNIADPAAWNLIQGEWGTASFASPWVRCASEYNNDELVLADFMLRLEPSDTWYRPDVPPARYRFKVRLNAPLRPYINAEMGLTLTVPVVGGFSSATGVVRSFFSVEPVVSGTIYTVEFEAGDLAGPYNAGDERNNFLIVTPYMGLYGPGDVTFDLLSVELDVEQRFFGQLKGVAEAL